MQFSDATTEVAFEIAQAGKVEQQVGVLSTDGIGTMWQALVRANRTNLVLTGLSDQPRLWKMIPNGRDLLVWLVEDQPGHLINHQATDCDGKDHAARMQAMVDSFAKVTAFYGTDVDFGEYEEATS